MKYVSLYDDEGNIPQTPRQENKVDQVNNTILNLPNVPNYMENKAELPIANTIVKTTAHAHIDPVRWRDPLYARGFTDAQIEYFNIRPGTTIFHDPVPGETAKDFEIIESDPQNASGWIYPMYYPQSNLMIDRIKYFPGKSDGPKARSPKGFRMPGGKHPAFYVPHKMGLERLRKAIAVNNGILFGVEGEPDNWAMDVMGIFNVTAFFGWSNVPDSLPASLKWLGVKRFIYITDNDEGGTRGAHNVWNALFYTDISFSIYQTPSTYNNRPTKDTNDILQAINYDPAEFTKYLTAILPANFKMEFEEPTRSQYEGFSENKEYLGIYNLSDMARDVVELLNSLNKTPITHFDGKGWSNNTQCPMPEVPHESDERRPAFGINIHSGQCNCFKCGNHSILAVAKKLGIDVNQYRLDRAEPTPPPEGMRRIEKVTFDDNNQQIGTFFSVAKQRGGAGVDYINSDPSLYVRPRRRVMQDIIRRADGTFENYLSFSVPWPMDDPQFTKLGGYCTLLPAGKLVQLISYTGGGKTTMMRSLEYAFNEIGIHTLLWSPEFDDMEHGDSTIQLVSGVSSIAAMKNDQYYIDKMNNVDISEFGTVFDEFERMKTKEAAQKVMAMPGESYLATQFSSDVYNMLLMFESICDYSLSEGNEIQVVIVDYAQLMQAPHGEKDWDINKSILAFKEWCNLNGPYVSPRDGVTRVRRRKVGIFTSQATKMAARAVQVGEQPYLTPEDAMEVRPDWANLILSTKMGGNFTYHPDTGHAREYEVYVCKNSKGDKREYSEAETGPVKMMLNLKNLRIMYRSERLMRQKEMARDQQAPSAQSVIDRFKTNRVITEDGEIIENPSSSPVVSPPVTPIAPVVGYTENVNPSNMYE
jgi:hypothetical protein